MLEKVRVIEINHQKPELSRQEVILHEQLALKRLRRLHLRNHRRRLWRTLRSVLNQARSVLFERPEAAWYLERKERAAMERRPF
jgi:hypothetical protein